MSQYVIYWVGDRYTQGPLIYRSTHFEVTLLLKTINDDDRSVS